MRKRVILTLAMVFLACAVIFATSTEAIDTAIDGAYAGFVTAVVSEVTEPKINLPGVTATPGPGLLPESISFVRSDISSYQNALRFFAPSDRVALVNSLLSSCTEDSYIPIGEFHEGDLLLDGLVRTRFKSGENGAKSVVELSFSFVVTGKRVGESIVLEGGCVFYEYEGCRVEALPGVFYINGTPYALSPVVLDISAIMEA